MRSTPPPLHATAPEARWVVPLCGLGAGLAFTLAILGGLALASRIAPEPEEEEVAEIRAVDIPEPPPPPPQVMSRGTPLPPAPMVFDEAPSTSAVRIAPTPIPVAPLLTVTAPSVSLEFSYDPGQYRPSLGEGDLDANHVFHRSEVDQAATPIYRKTFNVPADLARELKSTRIRVLMVVNTDGTVSDVRVMKGSHPEFDRLAVEAISEWRFSPGVRKGKKVRQMVELPVYFKQPSSSPFSVN